MYSHQRKKIEQVPVGRKKTSLFSLVDNRPKSILQKKKMEQKKTV